MGYKKRLNHAFFHAPTLELSPFSRYVFLGDCHRGIGNSNDNFLKNQHLYFAALNYYYEKGYTYIELGDGDELWEHPDFKQIQEIHSNVFWMFHQFQKANRLFLIYGNHDMEKKSPSFPLDFPFYEGIILKDSPSHKKFYLTHGHQADPLNSTFWRFSRFLVRFFWKPLEQFGVLDPTSAAKNYHVKEKVEKRLETWAKSQNITLICGHTHRPLLNKETPHYCNVGSCVHPRCITCIELNGHFLTLVKWSLETRKDMSLSVARTVLSGPLELE